MAYSRETWGSKVPRSAIPADSKKKDTLVLHHSSGLGNAYDTRSEQRAAMRSIQRFHVDERGWSDIGYSFVVFQPFGKLKLPYVYEGRGWNGLPAAQLNNNSGTVAVCIVGNLEHEAVKAATVARIVSIAKTARTKHGIKYLKGHRDYMSTDCPGDNLYSKIPQIAGKAGLRRAA